MGGFLSHLVLTYLFNCRNSMCVTIKGDPPQAIKKKGCHCVQLPFHFFLICYTPNRRYWIANDPDFDESLQGTKKEPIMSFYEQIYVCM